MQLSLKGPNGDIIQSYQKGRKEFVRIAGLEYEVYNPVDEFDRDPEIREMIEASEKDIKLGKVYSTEDMIEAVKRGEL
jgi:hypothetical protein